MLQDKSAISTNTITKVNETAFQQNTYESNEKFTLK